MNDKGNRERRVIRLFVGIQDTFSENPGATDKYEYEIILSDYERVFCKPYTIPFAQRDEVVRQINNMLREGMIEPGQTAYISPSIVV